ncbi:MAG: PAS domain-containing protein [candidate division Zixibacteria bacterium]|nr:PAS domain-containing protein [candidate division Zixibacteria bacterium]
MNRKRLIWQLFPSYLIVIILSLIATIWFTSRELSRFYFDQISSDLLVRARLIENQVVGLIHKTPPERIDELCIKLGSETSTRITIILPSGLVIGDSDEEPSVMDNHASRPEIVEALTGTVGVSQRFSNTIKKNMMYVAIPTYRDGKLLAVVRTSLPIASINHLLRDINIRVAIGGLIVAIIITFISFLISRQISRPLVQMKYVADRFARGELDHKLPRVGGSEEVTSLANALTKMASQLDDRIRTVIRQRNEMEAVLTSMVEGVMAVDAEGRVININQAAAEIFGLKTGDVRGQSIREVIPNEELQDFISTALSIDEPVEGEIILRGLGDRFIQTHGTVLRDGQGNDIGVVIVFNDITRLRRLENVRRDFVANVSHELKTPVTSIKGFVETLQDGAIENPEDAHRFLDIIGRQADHLTAIIEDLLALSRLEQETGETEIVLERGSIKAVLQTAIQVCEVKAEAKNININLVCPEDVYAKINPPLLEQAFVNLIDNAIKYSESGSMVTAELSGNTNSATIKVKDQGRGIEQKHLPRLFERFYRVDKARSKALGGTGLGLAIVKHITLAHGGRISVESAPGKGSTFMIHLEVNA